MCAQRVEPVRGEANPPQRLYDTTAQMQLGEPWRTVARAGVLLLAALVISLFFLVGIPETHNSVLLQASAAYGAAATELGLTVHHYAAFIISLEIGKALVFCAVAGLLLVRKPDKLGLFVATMLITFGLGYSSSIMYNVYEALPQLSWLVAILHGLGNSLLVIFLYVFPDGHFVPRWTRYLAPVVFVLSVALLLPNFIDTSASLANSEIFGTLTFFLILGMYLSGMAAQWHRDQHHATAAQAQQTKWVLIGLQLALLGYLGMFALPSIFPSLNEPTTGGLVYQMLSRLLFQTLAQIAIPITIALSVLRYRLWEVDFFLSRSVLYGGLTAALVGFFVLDMLVFQHMIQAILPGDQVMTAALVVYALGVGLSFQPIKRRLKRYVDRKLIKFHPGLASQPPAQTPVAVPERDTTASLDGNLSGARIGAYAIEAHLGSGGMAEVYKGQHTSLERPVAIKVMAAKLAKDESFLKRFEREAQTVATLKHPNIVEVFDFGLQDTLYYMVMEYIDGQDLKAYLEQAGPLPLAETRAILSGIASALDYAHSQGIVHRDVKPSNVMLQANPDPAGPELRPVLTDFGIAKIRTGQTGLTKTGIVGTLDYMAPEQIVSSREVDGRADVYALGVMLYQMICGALPFTGDNPGTVILGHLQQPPPDPRAFIPTLSEPVRATILTALAKDPHDRFPTAGMLVTALQE